MTPVIIGTAGHIDHGKSALVRALTGTDPDRLAEEQKRGMTIDIGFAFINEHTAIIDVPGHERFIKNMVAGVSSIDFVLLLVAANDSVMPQTREHLDILTLLDLKQGMIVITKKDLVDDEMLELVRDDIRTTVKGTFLENAPIAVVSSSTGEGIQELKQQLLDLPHKIKFRDDHGFTWMPVDRSFSIKGFGTVVTGSLLSGTINTGDTLELLPAGIQVKVRGLESHGNAINHTFMGMRTALNIANIAKDNINRGDVLTEPGRFSPSKVFDVKLTVLKSAKKALQHRARIRLHIGTREILARVKLLDSEKLEPGTWGYAQLLLEQSAVAIKRDPFVIRSYSPAITIGGGIILDTNARPQKRFQNEILHRFKVMEQQNPEELLTTLFLSNKEDYIENDTLLKLTNNQIDNLQSTLDDLVNSGVIIKLGTGNKIVYSHSSRINKLKSILLQILESFHIKEPLRAGINKAELKLKTTENGLIFDYILKLLISEKLVEQSANQYKLISHTIKLPEKDRILADQIIKAMQSAGFSPQSVSELGIQLNINVQEIKRILGALFSMGEIIKLDDTTYLLKELYKDARIKLLEYFTTHQEITVSEFRDLLQTSRKYSLLIILCFDQEGLTTRINDARVLNI